MKQQKTKAFTLVELIVVITILAILGTIAFISLQGYSKDARDSMRISDIKNLETGLEIYKINTGKLPLPEDYTSITASGILIRYQGILGDKVLNNIKISVGGGRDPKTDNFYTYIVDGSRTQNQLVGYFENEIAIDSLNIINNANSNYFTGSYLKSFGSRLGLITENNIPINENNVLTLDIRNSSNEYKIFFDTNDYISSSSGNVLFSNIYNRDKKLLDNNTLATFDDSLVGYWDMETTYYSGTTLMLKDLSQYNNHGYCYDGNNIVNCGTTGLGPQFLNGENNGKAMNFDGFDDFIEINKYFSYYGNEGTTFVIKGSILNLDDPNSGAIADTFIGNYCGQHLDTHYYGFAIKNNKNSFEYRDYSIKTIYSQGYKFSYDKYYFLVGTIHNLDNTFEFYTGDTNGIIKSTGIQISDKIIESTCKMRIGNSYGSMGVFDNLDGNIDEIRVYNRALSKNEISTVYGNTLIK